MSKFVKELVTRDFKARLDGVADAVAVSTVGMDAVTTGVLRTELAKKGIQMLVVKNSLARRATVGTGLANLFQEAKGQIAVCWGSTDFVALVKEVVQLDKNTDKFSKFKAEGGVLDGEALDPAKLEEVSKWPSREEQISELLGQILGPGSQLAAAILGPGATLASQVKQKGEGEEDVPSP
jgi:large subunit ribosomal protein L10